MAKSMTVTVTGVIGPGFTVTSLVFTEVQKISFDMVENVITLWKDGNRIIRAFDYNATTTVTYSISGSAASVTISQ